MQFLMLYFDKEVTELFHDVTDEKGHIHHNFKTPANFVAQGQIIARIVEEESLEILQSKMDVYPGVTHIQEYRTDPTDETITFDEIKKVFLASRPGYIIQKKQSNLFSVIIPLFIQADAMKAWYIVYSGEQRLIPDANSIINGLNQAGINPTTSSDVIQQKLKAIQNSNTKKLIPVLVSEGKEPVSGHPEYYELVLAQDTSVGSLEIDGHIDFRARRSFMEVQAGQAVMLKHAELKAIDGFDVYSKVITAPQEQPGEYIPGTGLIKSRDKKNLLVAEKGGAVVLANSTLSIDTLLKIPGDVGYETGHIQFDGTVQIAGAVLSGFSVKATGDVLIGKDIEDAQITAGGSVIISMGITGSGKSKISAGQDIKAEFVMNATLEARGNIEIQDSIVNSQVASNRSITVMAKHGQIIGGRTSAQDNINIKISGSHQGNETILEGGQQLLLKQELEQYEQLYTKWDEEHKQRQEQLKVEFGELLEEGETQVSELTQVRQDLFEEIKQLSIQAEIKRDFMLQKIQEVKKHNSLKGRPKINIEDKAYPGTIIKIDDRQHQVQEIMEFVRFYMEQSTGNIESAPLK